MVLTSTGGGLVLGGNSGIYGDKVKPGSSLGSAGVPQGWGGGGRGGVGWAN